MIGNTNGIYIPLGGGKTYIDLVPLIDITALGTASSSAVYVKKEQHFWYSGNCNLEDYMLIQISKPNSSTKDTLKFKYRYLIPDTILLNLYLSGSAKNFCYLYNNYSEPYGDTVDMAQFNVVSWYDFNMVLTEPSLISGLLILSAHSSLNPNTVATSSTYSMLIKVTKGSTEVIPIRVSLSSLANGTYYITALVQNVCD